jgi:hypothetical protein
MDSTMNATASPEQQARDLLERLEHPDAQSLSAGEVVELANLIAENERLIAGIRKNIGGCGQCEGRGQAMSGGELIDCDECADLRALLSDTHEPNSKRGSPPFPEAEAAGGGGNSPDVRTGNEV